jgi:hypothetical protein
LAPIRPLWVTESVTVPRRTAWLNIKVVELRRRSTRILQNMDGFMKIFPSVRGYILKSMIFDLPGWLKRHASVHQPSGSWLKMVDFFMLSNLTSKNNQTFLSGKIHM